MGLPRSIKPLSLKGITFKPEITGLPTSIPHIYKSLTYDRVAPSDGRINKAVDYFYIDKPTQKFQLVKDTEPDYYSIHFKSDRGSLMHSEVQNLINSIYNDLPENARLATWGSVSKGGFSGLHRFQDAGMIPTSETRTLAFKNPLIADEIANKYNVTLNEDGTVNWPIVIKTSDPTQILHFDTQTKRPNTYESQLSNANLSRNKSYDRIQADRNMETLYGGKEGIGISSREQASRRLKEISIRLNALTKRLRNKKNITQEEYDSYINDLANSYDYWYKKLNAEQIEEPRLEDFKKGGQLCQ